MTKCLPALLGAALLGLCACRAAPTPPGEAVAPLPASAEPIVRHPAPLRIRADIPAVFPTADPSSEEPRQLDVRGSDLSSFDLRNSAADLACAIFDDATIWPPAERLPPGFDPRAIMESGKNPGLGVRSLHEQGITGRGVGIAIIDQTLLVEHQEYAGQLRRYEEINVSPSAAASMHAPAVASIAVGKTVGVAPEADLYCIGTWPIDAGSPDVVNYGYVAQAVRRILEINRGLPEGQKIRVISMSIGWTPGVKGYDEIMAATAEARDAGLLVVCASIERVHGFRLAGLGRAPLADPERWESYGPGLFWAGEFYRGMSLANCLLAPMDARATASPGSPQEYAFYPTGGVSWAIPYIAGVYALAAQVDPAITPERFWTLALQTGRTITVQHGRGDYLLGPIIDPPAIIAGLQE